MFLIQDKNQVALLSNSDCQEKILGNETILPSMLCAGGEGIGTDKVNEEIIESERESFFNLNLF